MARVFLFFFVCYPSGAKWQLPFFSEYKPPLLALTETRALARVLPHCLMSLLAVRSCSHNFGRLGVYGTPSAEMAGRQSGGQADGALRSGKPCAAAGWSGSPCLKQGGAHSRPPLFVARDSGHPSCPCGRAIRRCALTSALHLLDAGPTWLSSERGSLAETGALVGDYA